MVKEVEVIKDGYETVVEVLRNAVADIETAQDAEIELAVASIKEKYATRLNDYKADLERYVHIETYEVPDEEQPEEGVCTYEENCNLGA